MVEYPNHVEFTEPIPDKKPGAPKVEIPPEIGHWLEESYIKGSSCSITVKKDDPDLDQLVRLLNLYAKRKGKKVVWELKQMNSQTHERLCFQLKDKKQYNRRSIRNP